MVRTFVGANTTKIWFLLWLWFSTIFYWNHLDAFMCCVPSSYFKWWFNCLCNLFPRTCSRVGKGLAFPKCIVSSVDWAVSTCFPRWAQACSYTYTHIHRHTPTLSFWLSDMGTAEARLVLALRNIQLSTSVFLTSLLNHCYFLHFHLPLIGK